MAEFELVIVYDKCTGCRICELGCSLQKGEANPQKSRIRIVSFEGEASAVHLPVTCLQCEKPVCEAVCRAGAISTDLETGARVVDKDKCIGCKACVYACPFGAIVLDFPARTPIVCDLCEGNPLCVRLCPFDAINYVRTDKVSIKLKRDRMGQLIDFINPFIVSSE